MGCVRAKVECVRTHTLEQYLCTFALNSLVEYCCFPKQLVSKLVLGDHPYIYSETAVSGLRVAQLEKSLRNWNSSRRTETLTCTPSVSRLLKDDHDHDHDTDEHCA
jgi:hypothetical protein